MKYLLEVCLIGLTLAVSTMPSVAEQSPAAPENSSFAGTWEGKMNDLPGINLKIQESDSQESGRKISGAIVFYFQERSDPAAPWHVAAESAVPLLAPVVEGETLTFEVQHHRCHGCSELGANVKFRMALAASNQARLWNLDEESAAGPGLKLIRRTEAPALGAQAMQKGISVELPVTSNASPMPDADQEGSLIVSVTENGSMYFGVDPVTPAAPAEKVKDRLSNREQKLYIKADARTPYADVAKVLEAARTAGVEAPVLLTAQPESPEPATFVAPKGLEVLVGPPPSGTVATVVQLHSGQQAPSLKINNEQIPWPALQSSLRQHFQKGDARVILLKADARLPFAHVVHAIDMCRSAGANVVLMTTGL